MQSLKYPVVFSIKDELYENGIYLSCERTTTSFFIDKPSKLLLQ